VAEIIISSQKGHKYNENMMKVSSKYDESMSSLTILESTQSTLINLPLNNSPYNDGYLIYTISPNSLLSSS